MYPLHKNYKNYIILKELHIDNLKKKSQVHSNWWSNIFDCIITRAVYPFSIYQSVLETFNCLFKFHPPFPNFSPSPKRKCFVFLLDLQASVLYLFVWVITFNLFHFWLYTLLLFCLWLWTALFIFVCSLIRDSQHTFSLLRAILSAVKSQHWLWHLIWAF